MRKKRVEKSYDPAPPVDKISLDCERRLQFVWERARAAKMEIFLEKE